jgi:hypothetical protein
MIVFSIPKDGKYFTFYFSTGDGIAAHALAAFAKRFI